MPFNNQLALHLQTEERKGFWEETGDFLQYGIAGALLSGGVGIANTFISLGNAFGLEAEEFDTEDAISGAFGANAADYYRENKAALDAVGFIGTSIIPGMAGVKALRAFQKGREAKLLTGLGGSTRNNVVSKLRKDIKEGNVLYHDLTKRQKAQLLSQGLKTQALETAAAEAAILATTNQNPFINREDLGYFDSIIANLDDAAIGIAIGGGLGGAIQYASDLGGLKRLAREAERADVQKGITQVLDFNTATGQQSISEAATTDGLILQLSDYNQTANVRGLTGAQIVKQRTALDKAQRSALQTFNRLTGEDLGTSEQLFKLAVGKSDDELSSFFTGMQQTQPIGAKLDIEADTLLLDDPMTVATKYKLVPEQLTKNSVENLQLTIANELTNPANASKKLKSQQMFAASGARLTDDQLADFMRGNEYGKTLAKQAEAISRKRRPAYWKVIDAAEVKLAGSIENLSPEEVGHLQELVDSKLTGRALLMDGVAGLTKQDIVTGNKKLAPDLFKVMQGNRELISEYGMSKAIIDLHTGEMVTDGIVPTIRDLGEVNLVGTKVYYGDDKFKVWDDKFDYTKADAEEASAMWYMAEKLDPKFVAPKFDTKIRAGDLPRLHAVSRADVEWGAVEHIQVTRGGEVLELTKSEVRDFLRDQKVDAATQLVNNNPNELGKQAIARILDVEDTFIERLGVNVNIDNNLAFRSTFKDPAFPSYTQAVYDKTRTLNNDSLIRGIAANRRVVSQDLEANWGVLTAEAGELASLFPSSSNYKNPLQRENLGADITTADEGAGIFTAAQGDFLGGTAFFQQMGKATAEVQTAKKKAIADELMSTVSGLRGAQDPAITQELSILNNSVLRRERFRFVTDDIRRIASELQVNIPTMQNGIIAKPVLDKLSELRTLVERQAASGTPDGIRAAQRARSIDTLKTELDAMLTDGSMIHEIKSPEVAAFLQSYTRINDRHIRSNADIAARRGEDTQINEGWIYPGKMNLDTNSHVAIVHFGDTKLFANKDKGVIQANSSAELKKKIADVEREFRGVKIVTPKDQDEWFKLKGEYDHQLSFNSINMDSMMQNRGIRWDISPNMDANVVDDMMTSLFRQSDDIVRQSVKLAYSPEFRTLEQHHANLGRIASVTGSKEKLDAFQQWTNIGLNINKNDKAEWWNTANEFTEKAINKMFTSIAGSFRTANKTGSFEDMNKLLEDYNIPKVYPDQAEFAAQFNAPRKSVNTLVAGMNGFVATTMLRMDIAQGIVNAMSTPIMLLPEMRALTKLAGRDRTKILVDGTNVNVPATEAAQGLAEGLSMPTNARLMYQATKDYFTDMKEGGTLLKEYAKRGLVGNSIRELQQALGDSALNPAKSFLENQKLVKNALQTVSGIKFNDAMEGFVKFVAARSAELAVDTLKVADVDKWQVITSMVNRVHGNYLASQRPSVFKGWMGQAVGLFQTYQFNMYQAMTRHIQRGDGLGGIGGMAALQGGIFGAQSLPGFQALSNYIGERSEDNLDFYSTANSLLGDRASEWLLYGMSSNFTKAVLDDGIALYSRGDLTPRTPVLLPTSAADIPIVNASAKAITNLVGTMEGIYKSVRDGEGGQPLGRTILEGIAHNGLNRPSQGIAQYILDERTTSKGNVIWTYDDWDVWSLATKSIGVSSLDEGIAVQSYYRASAYKAARYEKLTSLGQQVKNMVRAGTWESDQYSNFMGKYQLAGGDIQNYNRWINSQMTKASDSIIKTMKDNNNTPEGRYLQELLGSDNTNLVADLGGDQ